MNIYIIEGQTYAVDGGKLYTFREVQTAQGTSEPAATPPHSQGHAKEV